MMRGVLTAVVCSWALAACGSLAFWSSGEERDSRPSAERIAAALAAPDRPTGDHVRDETRHTAAVLALADVSPGERVLDVGAGGGYMTWLFSSLVGPSGSVTAQNARAWLDANPSIWPMTVDLASVRANVSHRVTDFDALEGAPRSYDLVSMTLVYHEAARLGADRAAMSRRLFELLKPGGRLLVVDHNARRGSDDRYAVALHRIDPDLVKRELTEAGFRVEREIADLENPADDLDLSVFDPAIRGQTSQFAILFVKPGR